MFTSEAGGGEFTTPREGSGGGGKKNPSPILLGRIFEIGVFLEHVCKVRPLKGAQKGPFWGPLRGSFWGICLTILKVHFGHVFDLLEGRVWTFSSLEIVTFELWIC